LNEVSTRPLTIKVSQPPNVPLQRTPSPTISVVSACVPARPKSKFSLAEGELPLRDRKASARPFNAAFPSSSNSRMPILLIAGSLYGSPNSGCQNRSCQVGKDNGANIVNQWNVPHPVDNFLRLCRT
jgi:hypothetical protein